MKTTKQQNYKTKKLKKLKLTTYTKPITIKLQNYKTTKLLNYKKTKLTTYPKLELINYKKTTKLPNH